MAHPITEKEQWMIAHHRQLPRPQDLPDWPEDHPLAQEWKTYKREIVRLLELGMQGRYAVIKGAQIVTIWDTEADAIQGGRLQFGLEPFLLQEIQPVLRPLQSGYCRLCLD
jgi:hypothetical protein